MIVNTLFTVSQPIQTGRELPLLYLHTQSDEALQEETVTNQQQIKAIKSKNLYNKLIVDMLNLRIKNGGRTFWRFL